MTISQATRIADIDVATGGRAASETAVSATISTRPTSSNTSPVAERTHVDRPEQIRPAMERALNAGKPALVNIKTLASRPSVANSRLLRSMRKASAPWIFQRSPSA